MNTNMNPDICEVQTYAIIYRNYYLWNGEENIRKFEMMRAKRGIRLTGLWYQVARRRYYLNKLMTGNWHFKN